MVYVKTSSGDIHEIKECRYLGNKALTAHITALNISSKSGSRLAFLVTSEGKYVIASHIESVWDD